MGYTPFNVGAAIRPPRPDDRLAERILHERQVFALLDAVADHPRDHALIRLLYNGGLRVSEAVGLEWRNLVDGVANIRGKGGRTRVVRLSRGTWAEHGWTFLRQGKGSHEVYAYPDFDYVLVIPMHGSEDIGPGLLVKLLKQSTEPGGRARMTDALEYTIALEEAEDGGWSALAPDLPAQEDHLGALGLVVKIIVLW